MFKNAASSSAFKPYNKTETSDDCKNDCSTLSQSVKREEENAIEIPKSGHQSHAFDYTIDNLLNCSSISGPSSMSKPSLLSSTSTLNKSNRSLIPIGILAHHLWWQSQQRHHPLLPFLHETSNDSITSSNLIPQSNLRRYLLSHQHHSRLPRGPRRQRTTFTHEQTLRLEMEYHISEYISRGKRFQLAELLDLTENQIKIWFQNRRAKDKRIEKAIIEQQFRFATSSSTSTSLPELNLSNCRTCTYTKQQFEGSSND